MNKYSVVLLFISLAISISAQDLKEMRIVGKAKKLESGEMVARRDQNGNYCAAIQVVSDMDGFSYDSFDGIVGTIDDKPGMDVVYLTKTERVLQIFKTGYKPLKIILSDLGITLKPQEMWKIEIAGDELISALPVTFRFTPTDATLTIDGKPTGTSATQNLAVGEHTIKIEKDGYQPIEETITVSETKVFFEWTLEKVRTQWLIINSDPVEADVYLNGQPVGKTPYQNEIQVNKYTYLLKKELYLDEKGEFELLASARKELNVQLKPNFGTLNLKSEPTGSTVNLNGMDIGKVTPCSIEKVPAGTCTISLSLNKYATNSQTVNLAPGETKDLKIQLTPTFGTINLKSKPENGARISLNGLDTGKQTPSSLEVPKGEATVTISLDMYETTSQGISVLAGENKELTIEMKPTFTVVNVSSNPSGEIYINNEFKGKNTWQGRLKPGVYTFESKLEKHKTDVVKQTAVVGTPLEVKLSPTPMTGILKIITNPMYAIIKLDGNDKGTTPTTIPDLLVGQYALQLEKQGYGSVKKTINIVENQVTEINETLPSGMEVTISSSPTGAFLTVDDINQGVTPQKLTLGFGNHAIKLVNGKKVVNETINLQQGGNSSFSFDVSEFPNFAEKVGNIEIEMIAVKGGTFTMGCTSEQSDCGDDEKPTHQVTVSDFYMGKYEVTQKQWREIMGASTSLSDPSYFKNCDNCPVEQVSWNDVQEFIKKLNQKTGKNYRLPTEAEWEYAARGGSESGVERSRNANFKYSGSNNIDEVAWYTSNSNSKTHPVGQKKPNALGIYDMIGNVWEWCGDWYGSDYYKSSPSTDPKGPSSGSDRVDRGGSWSSGPQGCRVAHRYYYPDYRYYRVGFRLSRMP